MLCFACFFLADAYTLQEFLLRNGIIGLDIICADACCRTNQLADDAVRCRALTNRFREVNDGFSEVCRPLFQIVSGWDVWLFANDGCFTIQPKRILISTRAFGL